MKIKTIGLFALLAFSVLSVSCSGGLTGEDDGQDGNGGAGSSSELKLSVSRSVIQANGEDVTELTVTYGGEIVTEDVRIYDGNNNPVDLPSMKFTTDKAGKYSFWAAYGVEHSAAVTVTAIDFPVPELPEDSESENLSFSRKVLVTQFTGTGCGYCPYMISLLRNMLADKQYADKMVLAACHTYNSSDPAYLSTATLDRALGCNGYPMLNFDMNLNFSNYNQEAGAKKALNDSYSRVDAKGGISASTSLNGNTVVAMVSVKAAETSEFRVGAWLLEDGIYGKQTNYGGVQGDFDTHDNCIRIVDSEVSSRDYSGHSLGIIEKGKTAEYAFLMTLEDGWKPKNCRLVLFISTPEGREYLVNNAVECDLNATIGYQYAK